MEVLDSDNNTKKNMKLKKKQADKQKKALRKQIAQNAEELERQRGLLKAAEETDRQRARDLEAETRKAMVLKEMDHQIAKEIEAESYLETQEWLRQRRIKAEEQEEAERTAIRDNEAAIARGQRQKQAQAEAEKMYQKRAANDNRATYEARREEQLLADEAAADRVAESNRQTMLEIQRKERAA